MMFLFFIFTLSPEAAANNNIMYIYIYLFVFCIRTAGMEKMGNPARTRVYCGDHECALTKYKKNTSWILS